MEMKMTSGVGKRLEKGSWGNARDKRLARVQGLGMEVKNGPQPFALCRSGHKQRRYFSHRAGSEVQLV